MLSKQEPISIPNIRANLYITQSCLLSRHICTVAQKWFIVSCQSSDYLLWLEEFFWFGEQAVAQNLAPTKTYATPLEMASRLYSMDLVWSSTFWRSEVECWDFNPKILCIGRVVANNMTQIWDCSSWKIVLVRKLFDRRRASHKGGRMYLKGVKFSD